MRVLELESRRALATTTLRDVLRRSRTLKGHAMKAAAAQVGVSTGTWSDWERGIVQPRNDKLAALSGYTGVTPADLAQLRDGVEVDIGVGVLDDAQYEALMAQVEERLIAKVAELEGRLRNANRLASRMAELDRRLTAQADLLADQNVLLMQLLNELHGRGRRGTQGGSGRTER